MQGYIIENQDNIEETVVGENISQETVMVETTAVEESIQEEIVIQETDAQEIDESYVAPAENVEQDPRRLGILKLALGCIVASITSSLILGGYGKFYAALIIGLIWMAMGMKDIMFPKS